MNLINQITEFTKEFECPDLPDDVLEATDERVEHLHFRINELIPEETNETAKAIESLDMPEVIDGFGDIAFLAINGIYQSFAIMQKEESEIPKYVTEVLHRIAVANLAKRQADGTILRNESGKVMKPNGWQKPAYGDLVNGNKPLFTYSFNHRLENNYNYIINNVSQNVVNPP